MKIWVVSEMRIHTEIGGNRKFPRGFLRDFLDKTVEDFEGNPYRFSMEIRESTEKTGGTKRDSATNISLFFSHVKLLL